MKLIKRYKNRKLYDTEVSRYINLGELFEHVRNGVTIKVINIEDEDITTPTLLRAVMEREKEFGGNFTTEMITSIINYGDGTLAGFVNNAIQKGVHNV